MKKSKVWSVNITGILNTILIKLLKFYNSRVPSSVIPAEAGIQKNSRKDRIPT
jgi:hypothetical protein